MKRKSRFNRCHPNYKEKLFIVCEGIFDKLFLETLFKQINSKYDIKIYQAGSLNKVFRQYKNLKETFSLIDVLIFIDLDANGNKNINDITHEFRSNGFEIPDIYFVNPSIEYLIVLAKAAIHSEFTRKESYKNNIKRLFGIDGYDGTTKECKKIIELIDKNDWESFFQRIKDCSSEVDHLPSTNINSLIRRIKAD